MPTTKLKFTETTKFKKGPQDRNLTGLNSKKQELGKIFKLALPQNKFGIICVSTHTNCGFNELIHVTAT